MRTGGWQRVAAAWAVRGQPYPAVGAELPVRCDLAAAIEALLDELVEFLLGLQEGGRLPERGPFVDREGGEAEHHRGEPDRAAEDRGSLSLRYRRRRLLVLLATLLLLLAPPVPG